MKSRMPTSSGAKVVDEAKHHSHLTKAQNRRLNKSKNRNRRRIYRQKH